jgi:hypothetical protein
MSNRVAKKTGLYRLLAPALAFGACVVLAGPACPANLLLNSSFELSSNRATPDYWDLHHAAALKFRDLHAQYNLDPQPGPIAAARVLKITNSETGFPFVYLLSMQPDSKLPAGDYVFSVYAKADRPAAMELAPTLDHMEQKIGKSVTTDWQRYSAQFHVDDPGKLQLSPLIALPSRGTYWISAPQLERGGQLTAYAPAAADAGLGIRTAAQKNAATDALTALAAAIAWKPKRLIASFEFNIYTDEPKARLQIANHSPSAFDGTLVCAGTPYPPLALRPGESKILALDIGALPPGESSCSVTGSGVSTSATLVKLAPAKAAVRINQFRNTLEVNKSGFHIRGVMIGDYVPADWYFSDIADHGINTVFFYPRLDADGRLDTADMDAVIRSTERHGLKLVIGPAVMGQKNGTWQAALDRYANLIEKYRNTPTILGWFAIDEPQGWTLRENELTGIYTAIKAKDPYRLVFINWGSDDVPATVGVQPHGSLAATDLYSIDYYPFQNDNTSLEIYALRTIRAMKTGMLAGRPGHSWLQLYGYLDAIREPTGDELNFMAYINLLYGGNYSYWQVKSNAAPTWDRLRKTNAELASLTKLLTLNPEAVNRIPPVLIGRYLYSEWETAGDAYLIVVHVADRTEPFSIDLGAVMGAKILEVRNYFGDATVETAGSNLKDSFNAYATKVYRIKR